MPKVQPTPLPVCPRNADALQVQRMPATAVHRDGEPERARCSSSARLLLVVVLICYCLYASAYIYRTSFVIDGKRCFCLFDDAMVSMRYARNLASGYGLVWNPNGERVEGFTNPLWTLFMALFHLFPFPQFLISLPIQISGAALILATLFYVSRMARTLSGGCEFASVFAVALTAFYLPLITWSLQGMEVSVLALLVIAATYHILKSRQRREFSWTPYALLGIAVLVRMDACVMLVTIALVGIVSDREQRARHALWAIAVAILALGSQTAFRLIYYGDFLPNTYYLKMTGYPDGLRMLRGLLHFMRFAEGLPYWLLVLALFPPAWRRDRSRMLLAALVGAQCAYSIYVGGDAWEGRGGSNRYISIVMPLFFILVAAGMADLVAWAAAQFGARWRRGGAAVRGLGVVLACACLVASNSFSPTSLRELLMLQPPQNQQDNALNVRIAQRLRSLTTGQALIALSWAGAIPYFSGRRSHDLLGKCDRRIARGQAHVIASWTLVRAFVPGHWKSDFNYSILQLKPDIVLRDVSRGAVQKAAFLKHYQSFSLGTEESYAKLGSPNVRWNVIQQLNAIERRRRLEDFKRRLGSAGPTLAKKL